MVEAEAGEVGRLGSLRLSLLVLAVAEEGVVAAAAMVEEEGEERLSSEGCSLVEYRSSSRLARL